VGARARDAMRSIGGPPRTSEDGWGWHRVIVERSAEVGLAAVPAPSDVLHVGCGTGALLGRLAGRAAQAGRLVGVDPAPRMVPRGRKALAHDRRVAVEKAAAERLPFPDRSFDLVVSTMSFDHWADQRAGLAERARVLRDEGRLVLTDLFAWWLRPTFLFGRRPRARTPRLATARLAESGLATLARRRVYDPAATAGPGARG
jgi:SAM-dependent methyltransferase